MATADRRGARRGAQGALIVEAALAIPVYFFFMLAILQIGSLAAAQTKVQVAVNQTAVEISQFSYARTSAAGADIAAGLTALQNGLDKGDLLGTGDSGNPIVQVISPGGSEKQGAGALLRRRLAPASGTLENLGLVGGIDALTVWFFGDRHVTMQAHAESSTWGTPVSRE